MSRIKNFKEYVFLHISIDDYLHMYYNFDKGSFLNMTHSDVNKLFPFIKRIYSKNITRENVLKGEVLLVRDSNNYVLAYQNPFVVKGNSISDNKDVGDESLFYEFLENCKDNDKVSIIFTVEDDIDEIVEDNFDDMNLYELCKKKKELVNSHDYKMARLVQKELYFRSHQEHGTKKSKIRKLENKKNGEEWEL